MQSVSWRIVVPVWPVWSTVSAVNLGQELLWWSSLPGISEVGMQTKGNVTSYDTTVSSGSSWIPLVLTNSWGFPMWWGVFPTDGARILDKSSAELLLDANLLMLIRQKDTHLRCEEFQGWRWKNNFLLTFFQLLHIHDSFLVSSGSGDLRRMWLEFVLLIAKKCT